MTPERAAVEADDALDSPADDPADVPADLEEPSAEEQIGRASVGPRRTAGLVLAALFTGASVALTGLMLWQHREVAAQRSQDQQFVDAARAGVTALLSIDHSRAQADVARVLDLSTGPFREDFERSADDFIKTAVDSKAVTTGTVNAAALGARDGDSGVVLVAATSEVTNVNGADQDPRPFRMNVTVTRDGGTPKIADVEFVP